MIKVRVKNRIITCKKELVEDNVDTFSLTFDFDSMWDGYAKRITFYNDGIEKCDFNPMEIPLDEPCIIPWEVIQNTGNLYLSVRGTKQGTNDVILTQLMDNPIRVNIAGLHGGGVPAEPTPDEISLIINIAQEAKDIAQSVRDDADAGKFQGEQGPKGDSGILVPISGMFSLGVDSTTGDLYAEFADNVEISPFEFEEDTGDLYYITG